MLHRLDQRRCTKELMDDPGLDPASHRQALTGLSRLNRVSRAAGVVWAQTRRMHAAWSRERGPGQTRRFRGLDLACGSADITRALALRSRASARPMHWCGVDVSELAVSRAGELARRDGLSAEEISFRQQDVLAQDLPPSFDLCTVNLFLHHLSTPQAVDLLRRAAAVCPRVLVNDLQRSQPSRWLVNSAAHLVTRSPVVHHDADASVQAAFTVQELRAMADAAGLVGARVRRVFPCRLLLCWERPR